MRYVLWGVMAWLGASAVAWVVGQLFAMGGASTDVVLLVTFFLAMALGAVMVPWALVKASDR